MSAALVGFLSIVAMEYLGLGYQFPVLQKLLITTALPLLMFAYVLSKHGLSELFENRQIKIIVVFIILTASAMLHGLIGHYAIDPFKQQFGYLLVLTVAYYALRKPAAVKIYFWFIVIVHAIAVVLNFDKFDQSERAGAFSRVGYFMGDGNDFAWSLSITFAFSLFLLVASKGLLARLIASVPALFILIGLVGTQSRGATLALSASMLYYLLFISKRKLLGVVTLLVVALGVWAFSPQGYFERMETISTYEEDTSATGRLRAWGHAVDMAIDHPILGVGAGSFNSAYGRYYRTEGDPQRWISTHSVYFKVLAEYGFTGIIIFFILLYSNFAENHRTARMLRANPGKTNIQDYLPLFINMALIAYAVAATFLSGLDYPHIYLITAATLAVKYMAKTQTEDVKDAQQTNT